jgi:nucleotide-binding universal stress UspA family protein
MGFADWVTSIFQSSDWPLTDVVRTRDTFVEVVARFASDMSADLIILTGVGAHEADAVADLAHACSRPTLLVRPGGDHEAGVLVATSLIDDGTRVLRWGAELARGLGTSVAFAYSAAPETKDDAALYDAARAELETRGSLIGREIGVYAEILVMRADSPVDSIVELATRQNWRLVVLGSYPRSWLTSWLVPSVCAEVVPRVRSSVAILPLA